MNIWTRSLDCGNPLTMAAASASSPPVCRTAGARTHTHTHTYSYCYNNIDSSHSQGSVFCFNPHFTICTVMICQNVQSRGSCWEYSGSQVYPSITPRCAQDVTERPKPPPAARPPLKLHPLASPSSLPCIPLDYFQDFDIKTLPPTCTSSPSRLPTCVLLQPLLLLLPLHFILCVSCSIDLV